MEFLFIAISSFLASLITFYSGFGLGTILMPVLAIFIPVPLAIILTAIVHFFHNAAKTSLLWKAIDWNIVLKFSVTAIPATILGAWLLQKLSFLHPIYVYSFLGVNHEVTLLKLIIGFLLILIATFALLPYKGFHFRNVFVGGALSGFLGGFSGNQGAFRSLFLITLKQNTINYISTNSAIAVVVDIVRLFVYGTIFTNLLEKSNISILTAAFVGALVGIIVGMIFLKSVTIEFIKTTVTVLLCVFGLLMIIGFI